MMARPNDKQIELDAIELWKSLEISYGNCEFSCGNDSMDETLFHFYDKDDTEIYKAELISYFDNAMYNAVDFYESSDGHYIGERGNVRFELDTDGNGFNYVKTSESEYSEEFECEYHITVNDEQKELINKFINGFVGSRDDGIDYVYKADLLINDIDNAKLELLIEFIRDEVEMLNPNGDISITDGDVEEYYTFSTGNESIGILTDNTVKVIKSFRITVFRKE